MDNKFAAPFLVLEILKAHTDQYNGLKVTQIVELLQEKYAVTANRKAVSRILNALLEMSEIPGEYDWHPMPYTIQFDTIPRSNGDIRENWRICREFEDGEVRLLLDLLQSVPGYPQQRLQEKLKRLGSAFLNGGKMHLELPVNKQMPRTIDCIQQAIREEKKITFRYGEMYTVSPYKMAFRNGNYYLLGYVEKSKEIGCFRIDKILDAEQTALPAKDYHTVSSMTKWGFDLEKWPEKELELQY